MIITINNLLNIAIIIYVFSFVGDTQQGLKFHGRQDVSGSTNDDEDFWDVGCVQDEWTINKCIHKIQRCVVVLHLY